MSPRNYRVSAGRKQPLVTFIREALELSGCRLLHEPDAAEAPYRFTFETPAGERLGIIVYAFFANSKRTKNRPADEHRFQVKYSSKTGGLHSLWQDPFLLYTTLFCGIDPERGIFVGADPVLHSPTRFFISIEYKDRHTAEILSRKWHSWERDNRSGSEAPIEVLVGGTKESFLRYIRFEREALGEDPGHRQLIAESLIALPGLGPIGMGTVDSSPATPTPRRLHSLAEEFQLSETEVLNLIASARRLKMAVRGWVAEEHLARQLAQVDGVSACVRNDTEAAPDISLQFAGVPLAIECKNVLRERNAAGLARLDFQRTRGSKNDPCSRFYAPSDFDVLSACLHAVERRWTFSFIQPSRLAAHPKCLGKLANNVRIDEAWTSCAVDVLKMAAQEKR